MSTSYQYRVSELRDLLAQLPVPANERVNDNLVNCIGRYGDLRQSALNDLVDIMAKASASNSGSQSKWQSRISRLRSDYNSLFADAARDVMLPPAHQLFWSAALEAEDKFFDSLSRVTTPQLMDDLLRHQNELGQLIEALRDNWNFLLTKNQSLQTDELRAMQDMDQMVQRVISEMDTAVRAAIDNSARAIEAIKRKADDIKARTKEALGRAADLAAAAYEFLKQFIIEQYVKPDGMPSEMDDPMKETYKQLELMAQALAERIRTYRTLLATYKDLVSVQKGSVLTMFNKTREDINRYLSTNGIPQARVWFDQSKGQLSDWVSCLPTPRQREDAAAFRDDIYRQLDGTWRITESIDNKFKSEFQGAFISPISNETIEKLAQVYLFREQLGKIKDRDLARKLEEFKQKLPDQMKLLEESLRVFDDSANDLPSEVRDLARSRNKEFQEFVHDRIKRQMESLLPIIDELKNLMAPSNMDSDFGRQELENMIR